MKLNTLLAAASMVPLMALSALAADCTPAHKFTTIKPGHLTAAAYELPPYISVKDGEFGGIDLRGGEAQSLDLGRYVIAAVGDDAFEHSDAVFELGDLAGVLGRALGGALRRGFHV